MVSRCISCIYDLRPWSEEVCGVILPEPKPRAISNRNLPTTEVQGCKYAGIPPAHHYNALSGVITTAVRLKSGGSFNQRPVAILSSHDRLCCSPGPGDCHSSRAFCSHPAQWLNRLDRLCCSPRPGNSLLTCTPQGWYLSNTLSNCHAMGSDSSVTHHRSDIYISPQVV